MADSFVAFVAAVQRARAPDATASSRAARTLDHRVLSAFFETRSDAGVSVANEAAVVDALHQRAPSHAVALQELLGDLRDAADGDAATAAAAEDVLSVIFAVSPIAASAHSTGAAASTADAYEGVSSRPALRRARVWCIDADPAATAALCGPAPRDLQLADEAVELCNPDAEAACRAAAHVSSYWAMPTPSDLSIDAPASAAAPEASETQPQRPQQAMPPATAVVVQQCPAMHAFFRPTWARRCHMMLHAAVHRAVVGATDPVGFVGVGSANEMVALALPPALRCVSPLLQRACTLGTLYRRLQHFAAVSDGAQARVVMGAVGASLVSALSAALASISARVLLSLDDAAEHDAGGGAAAVLQRAATLLRIEGRLIAGLARVFEVHTRDDWRVGDSLRAATAAALPALVDFDTRNWNAGMAAFLLRYGVAPLHRTLTMWVRRCELHDPFDEFFIVPDYGASGCGYMVLEERLYGFMYRGAAERWLRAGVASRILASVAHDAVLSGGSANCLQEPLADCFDVAFERRMVAWLADVSDAVTAAIDRAEAECAPRTVPTPRRAQAILQSTSAAAPVPSPPAAKAGPDAVAQPSPTSQDRRAPSVAGSVASTAAEAYDEYMEAAKEVARLRIEQEHAQKMRIAEHRARLLNWRERRLALAPQRRAALVQMMAEIDATLDDAETAGRDGVVVALPPSLGLHESPQTDLPPSSFDGGFSEHTPPPVAPAPHAAATDGLDDDFDDEATTCAAVVRKTRKVCGRQRPCPYHDKNSRSRTPTPPPTPPPPTALAFDAVEPTEAVPEPRPPSRVASRVASVAGSAAASRAASRRSSRVASRAATPSDDGAAGSDVASAVEAGGSSGADVSVASSDDPAMWVIDHDYEAPTTRWWPGVAAEAEAELAAFGPEASPARRNHWNLAAAADIDTAGPAVALGAVAANDDSVFDTAEEPHDPREMHAALAHRASRVLTGLALRALLSTAPKVGRLRATIRALTTCFLLQHDGAPMAMLDEWSAAAIPPPAADGSVAFDADVAFLAMSRAWTRVWEACGAPAGCVRVGLRSDHVDGNKQTPRNASELLGCVRHDAVMGTVPELWLLPPDCIARYSNVFKALVFWRWVDDMAKVVWRAGARSGVAEVWLFSATVRNVFGTVMGHVWHAVGGAVRDFYAAIDGDRGDWSRVERLTAEHDELLANLYTACFLAPAFVKAQRQMLGMVRLVFEVYACCGMSTNAPLQKFVAKRRGDFLAAAEHFVLHLEAADDRYEGRESTATTSVIAAVRAAVHNAHEP